MWDGTQAVEILKANGGNIAALIDAQPAVFARYPNGLKSLAEHYVKPPEFRSVVTYILNGPTGYGKSHMPACIHGELSVYRLTKPIFESKFWRGYMGEKVLVIEEFTKPWIEHSDLLSILDGGLS